MWLESALQYERDGEMERIFLIEPLLQADDVLIVMANDSMLDWARKFVHGRVLVMDTTFGLDRLGYSLCVHDHRRPGKGASSCAFDHEEGDNREL
jgi:hypothetical protein